MRILTLITTANLVAAQEYVKNGNACTDGENYMLDKSMLVTFPLGTSDDVTYPPTSNCMWTFNIPDEIVSAAINFIKIDIENSEDCGFDHLRVIGRNDGGDVEYQSERLCQEKNTVAPPIEFNATVRQIELLFTSDANIGKSGFSLLLRPIRNAGAEFDCDFNYDSICPGWTWSNEPQSVPWKPGFGSTMTQGTGPDQDYSKHGDRGYLYADASELLPQKSGDQPKWAYVATPLIDDPSDDGRDFCLEFYMHTFGDINHIAPLTIVVASQGQSSIKLLTQVPADPSKRQSSPAWKRVTVDFNKSNVGMLSDSKFLFQFVVAQVQGARADLAIDAVRLHKSSCNRLCPSGTTEFTCDATAENLQCLSLDKICDGENDCGNDRDEKGCEEGGSVAMPTAFTPTTAVPGLFFPTTMALMEIGLFDTVTATNAALVDFTTPMFNFEFPDETTQASPTPAFQTPAFPFVLDTTQSPDGFFDLFPTTGASLGDIFNFETTPAVNLFPDVLTTLSDEFPAFPTTPNTMLSTKMPLILTTESSLPSLKTTIVPTVMATTQMTDQTTTDEAVDVVTTENPNLRGTTTEPDLDNKMTTSVDTTEQVRTTKQQQELTTLGSQTTLADMQTTKEPVETINEPQTTSEPSIMTTEPVEIEELTSTVEMTTTATTTTEETTVTTSAPTTMNLFETTLEATSTTPLFVPLTTMPIDMFEEFTTIPELTSIPEFTTSSSTTSSMATTPPQENTLQQKFVTVEPNSMSTIERDSQDGIEQLIQLQTTIGHVLEFSIVRFNTQNPTCDDGNLSLFNGAIGTSSGTIVAVCSDETTPLAELGHFFSTGHMAFIYTSAGDYLIEARSVPKEEVFNFQFCGGENVYNSTGMHIASPGFPAKYEVGQQCGYILRRPNQRSLLHVDFKSFNFDPEYRGKFRNGKTCQGGDSVIFSQLSGARAEMIGTSCGMRSPGDLTFVADVKLDFITDSMDSMKDSSGFFAHVYSEDCETKGMTTESCLCRQTCDTDQCKTESNRLADGRDECKPGCACPPDKPVYDNGKCITREECRQAKPKPIEESSVNVITSPSQITIQFDRIPTVEAYNIILTEKTSEITDGSEAPVARRRVPELNMPNAPSRNSVTFEGLDPDTEYEAAIFTEISDAKDAGNVVFSVPVKLTKRTNERNLVLPVEEETLIIEQLSNYICLVITKQRPDLEKIRVAINEKFPSQNDLNREQRVIVPSIPVNGEIRACFSKLRAKTRYELKVVGLKDNAMSETLTLDVDTLEEDIEWKKRWYQWRYYSFNQWIKSFDQYQRVAQVRGIWTDPRELTDFACPAMLGKLPCKGATIDWRDLNQCAFSICENPPTFDELQRDNDLLDFQTMGAWEHEYDVYKKYLWPQWNRVLRRYVAVYSAKLNGGRATS